MAERVPDLSLVRHLKTKGRFEEAERQLTIWLEEDPENPRLLLEMATLLDNQGREGEAIPFYEGALAGELDRPHRVDAYVGLGSSLRVEGRIHDSEQLMQKAMEEYPHHMALKVFSALTLERMGNYGEAIQRLLDVIVESGRDPSLDAYRPAIRYYRDHRHDGRLGDERRPYTEG
ncbi:MAG: tetratricopeptide repeat protein [Firmicutes bacterium]|nr:tetratricopeptide repeat protein [Bacillota bacterium]